ncbi:putative Histidine kinase [Planktothrix serta PCC 8927]|uniref:Circadian input-output histidine kinase CikA n=1 Tax=Planktothrix serta PCC 8927 TaxID=671068 RepID=A0A7Z9DWN8_9CYAN|nr:PAS domain S-box protein [Planktothrix serta]VXD15137.1 putative Histidine kinase [Planktothrix serta PCC 8927]
MDLNSFLRSLLISQTWGKIPLRFVLIIPFVIQITATVLIVGYLSFRSGQRAVEKMSSELMNEVTQRVEDHIDQVTETAKVITNHTLDQWEIDNTDLSELLPLEEHLFLTLRHFKLINRILIGNEQHDFLGVTRLNGQRAWYSSPQDSSLIYDYAIDQKGKPIKLLGTFWKPSVTLRPWYQDAVKNRKTSWGSLYPLGSNEDLGLSLNTPIYDRQSQKLLGVLSVGIISSNLSDFLSQIRVGKSGKVIIIDRNGNLVASSQGQIYQKYKGKLKFINLVESQDQLYQNIGNFLIKNFGEFPNVQKIQNVNFTIPPTTWGSLSNHYFLQVAPLKNQEGLDLLMIVVIPQSDFMTEVNAQFKQTLFLCIGVFFLATGVGILISRWIIKPILAVNQAAKQIATGEIKHLTDFERTDEIGELVQSFKGMTNQLQTSLENLQKEIIKHQETEAKLRHAQRISKLSVWEFHCLNKTLIWSPEIYQIYGFNFLGKLSNIRQLLPYIYPDDHPIYFQEVIDPLRAKKPFATELRILRADGSIRYTEVQGEPIFDQQGNTIRLVGTIRDITERKQAEITLKNQEQLLRSIYEGVEEPIFVVDVGENGEFRYAGTNSAHEKITGLSRKKILGKTPEELKFPAWKQVIQHYQDCVNTGTSICYEEWVVLNGVETFWYTTLTPLKDLESRIYRIVGTTVETSYIKQTERSLQTALLQIQKHFEYSPLAIIEWDSQGKIKRWSKQAENIFGWKAEEVIGLSNHDFLMIYEADQERVNQGIMEMLTRQSNTLKMQNRNYTKNHDLISCEWFSSAIFDQQGNLTSALSFVQDITDRQQSEQALRQSEARWRHLIEANIVGIIFADFEGKILAANDAFLRMIGYSREELENGVLRWDTITPPDGKAADQERVRKILRDKILPPNEKEYLHKDGTRIPVILGATLLEEQKQCVAFVLNITQQKQTEIELQKAKEQAEAANRAKSTFLSNMSHELRTPLNAILGFTQLMVRDSTLAPHHREKLQIINRNGAYLLQLINDILSISKIEANRVIFEEKTFDLYQLLEDLEDTFELRAASKGLELIIERSPNLPQYLKTDERKLRQVLINLLDNGIKFTDHGSVTLRITLLEQSLNPGSAPPDYTIEFEVEDTGAGVAPEELDTMFDAFVQTSSGRHSQQGTGLGLPISRRFVELMGGQIQVSSQIGRGTQFQFTIQALGVDPATVASPEPQYRVIGLAPHQPLYRILVVDDLEMNRQWFVKLLRSVGFEVEEAENGEMALNLVESYDPHLIWMDMRMSGIDGYRATQEIRAKKAQTLLSMPPDFEPFPKIIAVSASVFEEERQKIIAAGCDDFVGKPLTEARIWEILKKHLGVKYRVEDFIPNQVRHHQIQDATIIQALATLPPELLNQLAIETQIGDSEKLLSLLTQIPSSQRVLINTLTELINNFEFEVILNWVTNTLI